MKKFTLAFVLIATLVVALITTGFVSAQGPAPVNPQAPATGTGYGRGGMNAGGMMGGRGSMGANVAAGEGILHDGMIAVYAEKLGISVADLNARLMNGETISQIAAEKGLSAEQFTALMSEARSQAIDQAVKAGTLTQEQGDWLKTRGAGMMGAGQRGAGRGGMRGNGAGFGTGDPATCPYFTQTNP
jgi:hypothetical protein